MRSARFFWPGVAVLLGLMAIAQVRSALLETQSFDEAFDLAAGYSYWKTGDFRINREHPPLGKFINAIPLLFLKPTLPLDHPSWKREDSAAFGDQFLYRNRIPADTLLFAGRSMSILTTLVAALCFALWMRRRFGPLAALVSLSFFTLDPNLIAHGRYVTSDIFLTVFFFFAAIAWAEYLESPRPLTLVTSGILLGLALTSKLSAIYLLPVFFLLALIRFWQMPALFGLRRPANSVAGILLISAIVIAVIYAPEAGRLLPATRSYRIAHPEVKRIHQAIEPGTRLGDALSWAGRQFGIQNHSFLVAMNMISVHNAHGHPSFILGRLARDGVWYYFPVAFAVKTPVAVLLALAAAVVLACRRRLASLRNGVRKLVPGKASRFEEQESVAVPSLVRGVPILWFCLILVPAGYFAASMAGNINLGLRHILPVYPFLYAILGATLSRLHRLTIMLVVLLAIESFAIHPHYLAYFNFLSGGPGNGPRYLVDSNIDWGQDIKKLRNWMRDQNVPRIGICYFGRADLTTYGLPFDWLPSSGDFQEWDQYNGFAAASVTPLQGVYVKPNELEYLRRRTPVVKIGYSIYVYDLRRPSAEHLRNLTAQAPIPLQAETHHVQGIDVDTSTLWLSSVDRSAKRGLLFQFDRATGKLLRSTQVQQGVRYHPGGISLQGDTLWVPVAEYRPASSSFIQKRDARTLALESEFSVADHIGAIAAAPEGVVGANWDAHEFYVWTGSGTLLRKVPNPTGLAVQDMKFNGGVLIASGLYSGGNGAILYLEWPGLRVLRTMQAHRTDRGVALTHEGFAILGRTLFFLPEDSPSRLFAFDLPAGER